MTIISKEVAIQDKLSTIFDEMINQKENIRRELVHTRNRYKSICELHITSGFNTEYDWVVATDKHEEKYLQYDAYCYLIELLTDYRDIEGYFPEYEDMLYNLEQLMFKFARTEQYEVSAIIKCWLSKFLTSMPQ